MFECLCISCTFCHAMPLLYINMRIHLIFEQISPCGESDDCFRQFSAVECEDSLRTCGQACETGFSSHCFTGSLPCLTFLHMNRPLSRLQVTVTCWSMLRAQRLTHDVNETICYLQSRLKYVIRHNMHCSSCFLSISLHYI